MSEFPTQGYEFVNLVDRTGKGGCEIIHDGIRIVFKPGQKERPVPLFLAEWLARVDQQRVHTTGGEWVQRFGVRDAPDELTKRVGEMDCSPIDIDTQRVEGWDTDAAPDRGEGQLRTIQLKRNPSDYANVAAGGGTFSKER
jgi:hypothetical protein